MDRLHKLLCRIDKSMKVLEIGPSFSPIAPKSAGWNAWSVDHTDQEGLQEKYEADPNVDISQIGPVDFVWQGGDLDTVIPVEHHGSFDACIASHVIEHMPDPVGFYRSLGRLLRPSGVVALAVPDKRFCFDYFRQPTMTSEFILAHSLNRRRHSKKTAFDHTAYTVSGDGAAAWSQHPVGDLRFYSDAVTAFRVMDATEESEAASYVDYHGWCYTPSSFKLVVLELNLLGLIDWHIDMDYPAEGCEFIVVLKKGQLHFSSNEAVQESRKALLKGIIADIAEQHRYASSPEIVEISTKSPFADGVMERLATLEQQQLALSEGLARQEAKLGKIWKTSKIANRLLQPFLAVARASRGLRTRA